MAVEARHRCPGMPQSARVVRAPARSRVCVGCLIGLEPVAQFVFSALTTAPRPLLPFEIFVQLLGLFVTLNGGASIKYDLLPVRRTVEVNIIAADDL